MKLLVLAAGRGTRMGALTDDTPKPLLPLAGATILDHALAPLLADPDPGRAPAAPLPLEIDELVFVVGYLGAQLRAHAERRWPGRVRFVEQAEPLGQAHAVALAAPLLMGPTTVLLADTLHQVDGPALARRLAAPGAPDGVLHLAPCEEPSRFGVAVVEDDDVARLVEKPRSPVSERAVVGVYGLRSGEAMAAACRAIVDEGLRSHGEHYLADALQRMIDEGARFAPAEAGRWLDCGTAEALAESEAVLAAEAAARAEAREAEPA